MDVTNSFLEKKGHLCNRKTKLSFTMHIKTLLIQCMTLCLATATAQTRQWQTSDGLPTDEVRQIVPLPNHQMLINCEGVFCISDGEGFVPVKCDRRKTYRMKRYAKDGYAQLWQGDSLLWLRDYYRLYLFDVRTMSFRYDIKGRLRSLSRFVKSPATVRDWQGGTWTCTTGKGITYTPPARAKAENVAQGSPIIGLARKAAVMDVPLDGGRRRLQCQSLNKLTYLYTNDNRTVVLNEKLPQLNNYRHIVGACPLDNGRWVAVYTQNGAFTLDTKADTIAPFVPSETIGEHTDKYNCMLRDNKGSLWIGTQNGLFETKCADAMKNNGGKCRRIAGLANNCIRSLVMDSGGCLWAGTSSGISRITPTVTNYGESDGIPPVAMMERAVCLTEDGSLVFVLHNTAATTFRPEWLTDCPSAETPTLTQLKVDGNEYNGARNGGEISLAHNENYLTFHFSALDYAHPTHVRYRYRLKPLETNWHLTEETRGQAVADYKSLSPGDYTFEAQAASSDGKWSGSLMLDATVNPPIWLTWWAKTIYTLLAIAAIAVLLASYIKRKKAALERENENRVNQLFERREEARHQFAQNTRVDPSKIGINDEEARLTAQLLAAVEAHLDEEDYNVDLLARDVGLSRTNLYAKLRNMLGISPAEFMRNVRLKAAAQLLSDTSLSVSEVASRVGFATARNFSASFKKTFGVLPSEYRDSDKQK